MPFLTDLGITVLKSAFTNGVSKLWSNKNFLSLYVKTLFGKYRNKDIRFSIAYLFRIKIPETNSYLLVFNRRIANQLQPVGGAYKRYGDDKLFESWGYQPDKKKNGLGTDAISENDLRFFVKGKNVIDVIKWFDEGKERECSAYREFWEELLQTEILPKEAFAKIKYKHLKRESKHLKWSDHHGCYEVLIYDIYELMPIETQGLILKQLAKEPYSLEKGYAIVECEDIEQMRLVKDNVQAAKIGEHTKLTINKN
jgi:hypothetical protein